jgi:hypothetical protein
MLIVFAIAKQLHTKPTTRTEVLTARFMVVLLTCGFPGSGNPGLVELYPWCQADLQKYSTKFSCYEMIHRGLRGCLTGLEQACN